MTAAARATTSTSSRRGSTLAGACGAGAEVVEHAGVGAQVSEHEDRGQEADGRTDLAQPVQRVVRAARRRARRPGLPAGTATKASLSPRGRTYGSAERQASRSVTATASAAAAVHRGCSLRAGLGQQRGPLEHAELSRGTARCPDRSGRGSTGCRRHRGPDRGSRCRRRRASAFAAANGSARHGDGQVLQRADRLGERRVVVAGEVEEPEQVAVADVEEEVARARRSRGSRPARPAGSRGSPGRSGWSPRRLGR